MGSSYHPENLFLKRLKFLQKKVIPAEWAENLGVYAPTKENDTAGKLVQNNF
jgi:hypothetical protein